jgi:hypothetical protein
MPSAKNQNCHALRGSFLLPCKGHIIPLAPTISIFLRRCGGTVIQHLAHARPRFGRVRDLEEHVAAPEIEIFKPRKSDFLRRILASSMLYLSASQKKVYQRGRARSCAAFRKRSEKWTSIGTIVWNWFLIYHPDDFLLVSECKKNRLFPPVKMYWLPAMWCLSLPVASSAGYAHSTARLGLTSVVMRGLEKPLMTHIA